MRFLKTLVKRYVPRSPQPAHKRDEPPSTAAYVKEMESLRGQLNDFRQKYTELQTQHETLKGQYMAAIQGSQRLEVKYTKIKEYVVR